MQSNKAMPDRQQFITGILQSDSSLENFMDFWSKQYKYAFYSVLELYTANPQGTFFAETKQWNMVGRSVIPGSVSVWLNFPDGSHKNVFDISQTQGKELSIWQLPAEHYGKFFLLPEKAGTPDVQALMGQLKTAADKEIPRERVSQDNEILLAGELAARVTAARLNIQAPDISADGFDIHTAYNIFVASHLAARNLLRRAEIFTKNLQREHDISDSDGKENKAEGGSDTVTPVFHAPKRKNADVPEQLSFGNMEQEELHTDLGKSQAESINSAPVKTEKPTSDVVAPQKAAQPKPEPINYRIPDDFEPAAGQKGKFKDNIAAITLLKNIEDEDRSALPGEQAVLARYNGWGGLPQAFDPRNSDWAGEYSQLKELLTPEEYATARASTLNAHYTSKEIIDAIYKGIGRMGFNGGNVLEPAMGTGNFFGRMPEYEKTTMRYGVELDDITGRIAKQLYPKATIKIDGFENMKYNADSFDLAVGNVPFGSYTISDRTMGNKSYKIHDYFFLKSIDLVRPGGIVAYITSTGTLDKTDPAVRERIAEKAELLGAIRLPQGTFRRSANTEVCTDIIFLQKRAAPVRGEMPYWTSLLQTENGVPVNAYYARHPEMMLGHMEYAESMYNGRNEPTLLQFEDKDFSELLQNAVLKLPANIYEPQEKSLELEQSQREDTLPAIPGLENHAFAVMFDSVFIREGSVMIPYNKQTGTTVDRIKGMVQVRDELHEVINAQLEGRSEEEMRNTRMKLNTIYDRFVKKYGYLNNSANIAAFSDDPDALRLSAIEEPAEEKGKYIKSDIFTKPTIARVKPVTHTDTASEALAVSLAQKGCVDVEYMSQLYGHDSARLVDELRGVIFKDPEKVREDNGGWVTASEYLSGNVRAKLSAAKAAGLADNTAALEKALPEWLPADKIEVKLGTYWIPPEYIADFISDTLELTWYNRENLHVNYIPQTAQWVIEFSSKYTMRNDIANTQRFGTQRACAIDIIENSLNLRQATVTDQVDDKRVVNKKETIAAREKQELLQQRFKSWIFTDDKRRERLERIYNERFNAVRLRDYNGSILNFPGMTTDINLRQYQKDAVARVVYGGNTLLAHCVGAGKTFVMISACMELRRLGLARKPMIVVPNHLCEQWAKDFLRLYPDAKILAATKKDFESKKRRKLMARISAGDYDAVIIGHSSFGRIPVSNSLSQSFIGEQLEHIDEALDNIDSSNRRTVKQLEAERKRLEDRQKTLIDEEGKDEGVTFEELGVDEIFVDEAHAFKNLFLTTKMQNVAGISTTHSKKASDLYMKCRYVQGLHDERGGVVFATGTPISNTMAEVYNMQRYLQYDRLKEAGLDQFDAWASAFGEVVAAFEVAPDGSGYRVKNRFSRFHNMPELMTMFREVADIQTADMLKLPKPDLKDGKFDIVEIARAPEYEQLLEEILERSERIHSGVVDPREDNYLKLTMDARDGALDMRLVRPDAPDRPDSKVNICVENTFNIYTETAAQKYVQVIFCDRGTPCKGFNIYDDMREKLISRGVAENEIAYVQNCKSDLQKEELFAQARRGDVRIIFASTALMGAGTNIQDLLYAQHDLDIPWRPSDLEQRSGRILRYGNTCPEVRIFRYVTQGSFDSYSYQTLETKQRFISQVMNHKSCAARSVEDVDGAALSYAEIKAIATGNPLILEKFKVDGRLQQLEVLKSQFESNRRRMENDMNLNIPSRIKLITENLENLIADTAHIEDLSGEHFHMKVGQAEYTERKDAGEKLNAYLAKAKEAGTETAAGEISGFKFSVRYEEFGGDFKGLLCGQGTYTFDLSGTPLGNIMRIENALSALPEKIDKVRTGIENEKKQLSDIEKELRLPFEHADELSQLTRRKTELDSQLDLDRQSDDTIGLDNEPDMPDGRGVKIKL